MQDAEIQTESEIANEQHNLIEVKSSGFLQPEDVERMRREVEIQDQIKQLVVMVTKPNHWDIMGDKPYLNSKGVRAISALVGISTGEPKTTSEILEDEFGKYTLYTTDVECSFRGRICVGTGTCSTRDKFFAKVEGKLKPLSEINVGHIKKKSITNARSRGIKDILGIDFDEELLAKVGVDLSKSNKVDYNSKTPKKEKTEEDKTREHKASKMILEMFHEDQNMARAYCIGVTTWETKGGEIVKGKPRPQDWSAKQLNMKMKTTIEPDYKKFQETGEPPEIPGAGF